MVSTSDSCTEYGDPKEKFIKKSSKSLYWDRLAVSNILKISARMIAESASKVHI